jgi:hypothetical protein
MAKLLRVIGHIWLGLLAIVVAIGGISILLTEGIWKFWEVFNLFNIWNWGLIFILALPALGLYALAKRIEKKPPK